MYLDGAGIRGAQVAQTLGPCPVGDSDVNRKGRYISFPCVPGRYFSHRETPQRRLQPRSTGWLDPHGSLYSSDKERNSSSSCCRLLSVPEPPGGDVRGYRQVRADPGSTGAFV